MIRVGSYVWYHDRRDPTDIMKQFGECDVILLQRFPNALRSYFGDCWYIENWQSHGMLVRGCKQITTIELPNNIVPENQSQGKYIPILHMDNCKIISCLTSYDHAGMDEQLDFVCSLIDDDVILVSNRMAKLDYLKSNYKLIVLPIGEEGAANSLRINNKLLVPDGFTKAEEILTNKYNIIKININEIAIVDAGGDLVLFRRQNDAFLLPTHHLYQPID